MRILYFSPRECWPLTTGARLRDYHLARRLALRASVTYLGLRPWNQPVPTLPPSASGFENVLSLAAERPYTPMKLVQGLAGPDPVTVLNYWSPAVAKSLRDILRSSTFDTIQMEGVHLVRYLSAIREAAPLAWVLVDWHNIESEILWRYSENTGNMPRRWYARRTAHLLERGESRLLADGDAHTVTSDRERDILLQRCPGATIHTLPNGVDVDFYAMPQAEHEPAREILFVGSMDYSANIDAVLWFVRDVWPAVRQRLPGLQLTVVGRNPPPSIQSVAATDIAITGTVDDVRTYYNRALAVVAPLRIGSGTRLKILEAMAAGVPVVSTHLGAEGLSVSDGREILLADTADSMADALHRLASLPDLRKQLIRDARIAIRSYDWAGIGDVLYNLHSTSQARHLANRASQAGH